MQVTSCDTFVVLPPATGGAVVFGKNSDRPDDEVQEVLFQPAQDHTADAQVKCTYISIPQSGHTHGVVLSKPAWMWGAEMGANEHGVVVGNEAVWTRLCGPADADKRLLGMDLVRLGLERSNNARECLHVMTSLLEIHGQGGPCSCEPGSRWAYHNSYMLADPTEAWVLETCGQHWAAENVTEGIRNISNQLTIRTRLDAESAGLRELAAERGWWQQSEPFDFAKVMEDGFEESELSPGAVPSGRQQWGTKLLRDKSRSGPFSVRDMMDVLRHEESGICMQGSFLTTGSQVSVLWPRDSGHVTSHWFTATPDPTRSVFKPFVFGHDGACDVTASHSDEHHKNTPHELYSAHQTGTVRMRAGLRRQQLHLEQVYMDRVEQGQVGDTFKNSVEEEMALYQDSK